jgi:excisionase family DNA binding protein
VRLLRRLGAQLYVCPRRQPPLGSRPEVRRGPRQVFGTDRVPEKTKAATLRFPERHRGLQKVGETGFEPATPWSRGPQADPHGVVPGPLASYPLDDTGVGGDAGSHTVAPVPPDATPFGALVVQAEPGDLLTVPEVAARLRVSRATIYRLFRTGTLPGLRVSNAIRVPAEALDGLRSHSTPRPAEPPGLPALARRS